MTGKRSGAAEIADLGAIIDWLDRKGRLVRVRSEVDPAHQLAGIAAKFERGPRAVLFEKVKGSRYPVFTGLYWSRELLGDLFGRPGKSAARPSAVTPTPTRPGRRSIPTTSSEARDAASRATPSATSRRSAGGRPW